MICCVKMKGTIRERTVNHLDEPVRSISEYIHAVEDIISHTETDRDVRLMTSRLSLSILMRAGPLRSSLN